MAAMSISGPATVSETAGTATYTVECGSASATGLPDVPGLPDRCPSLTGSAWWLPGPCPAHSVSHDGADVPVTSHPSSCSTSPSTDALTFGRPPTAPAGRRQRPVVGTHGTLPAETLAHVRRLPRPRLSGRPCRSPRRDTASTSSTRTFTVRRSSGALVPDGHRLSRQRRLTTIVEQTTVGIFDDDAGAAADGLPSEDASRSRRATAAPATSSSTSGSRPPPSRAPRSHGRRRTSRPTRPTTRPRAASSSSRRARRRRRSRST